MRTLLFLVLLLTTNYFSFAEDMNCQTVAIPSQIESENYCQMSGIQTETTQDENGGMNIGYIDDNDWMSYNISVANAGTYKVEYRIASQFGGNQIQIDKDGGQTVLGTVDVPSTGGWQSWETIQQTITLPEGNYSIGINAVIGGFNINWVKFTFVPNPNEGSFLHTSGQNIVDGNGNNILLKSVNLDGWMVQEGYIMEVPFGPQWEIMDGIKDVIGDQNTQEFHDAWLDNMVTEADFQKIKEWGFNSIRVPLHYNLFTLSIQEEPVPFESTVLPKGYELVDKILAWAEKYELYLILDLHAAPGGQGEDQPISDYNPSYPSLWESGENRSKTVHLWKEIASRYADEEWIAGYDLINETNWELENNNQMLFELYQSILWEVRQVDNNHIVFIEGNWWANDFRGLTPAFDDNMVYAFHKYWSAVDQASIQEFIDIRNNTNTPIWCGETGENSNQWYAESFELLEENNIGYAFWPLKKMNQIQGLLKVVNSQGLQEVLDYWNGEGAKPSVSSAKSALMEWAQNTRIDNCVFNYSVIDATTRMVGTTATIPYEVVNIPSDIIDAVHYDLGKQGFAYYEEGFLGDYGDKAWWNINWTYRNDAVDIYQIGGNGDYYIGETKANEWLAYTVNVAESGNYKANVEVASNSNDGAFHLEINGVNVTGTINVNSTNGWEAFSTVSSEKFSLGTGQQQIKFVFEKGGFNLKSLQLIKDTIEEEDVLVTGIALSENTLALKVNETASLSATVLPSNATDKTVTWSSSNSSIASVNATGNIIAIAEGSAIITAQSSNSEVNAQATITVSKVIEEEECTGSVTVSLDFSYDGMEEKCWVVTEDIGYINSWAAEFIYINGVDITNVWVNNMPPKDNGKYYISFKGALPWAHIEIMGASNQRQFMGETLSTSIKVYPNPSHNSDITIEHSSDKKGGTLKIVDLQGRTIYNEQIDSNKSLLPRNLFHVGMYVITVELSDNVEIIKLIVE